ncbi:MAG: methyltransferase domain-containing protein [Thermoplasmata archaeon]|nr:methyltransferase domain-containing protein [Thermoplasmata archaeon]
MRSLAVVVPTTDGERIRQRLKDLRLLRSDLRVGRSEGMLAFPVRSAPPAPIPGTVMEDREFESVPDPAPASYAELADVPEEVRAMLPRAFDIVGDIVLVRLDPDQARWAPAVGEALRRFVPGARLVAWDQGVHGDHRIRSLVTVAGSGGYRTIHRENGIHLQVDLEQAYFSPRLGREHARVAAEGRPGERAFDLCCGVGPFGLTMLSQHHAGSVTFVDVNPGATALVEENARRLGLLDHVEIVTGDLEEFLATRQSADRVVFNLPHGGIKYVSQDAVARGGTLHYYEIMERSERSDRLGSLTGSLPGRWTLRAHHPVHPYSPTSDVESLTLVRQEA